MISVVDKCLRLTELSNIFFSVVFVILDCIFHHVLGSRDLLGVLFLLDLVQLFSQLSNFSFSFLVFSLLFIQLSLFDGQLWFEYMFFIQLDIYLLFHFIKLLEQIITCIVKTTSPVFKLLGVPAELVFLIQLLLEEVFQFVLVLLVQLLLDVFLVIKILKLFHIHLHLFLLCLQDGYLVLFKFVVWQLAVAVVTNSIGAVILLRKLPLISRA